MNGILNVLKPPGMTSHDVVSYIRKVTGIKKIGHTGTLDPGAAGVLPICIGKATKIVDYILNDKKSYICELTLGNVTDTYDKYGTFLYEEDKKVKDLTIDEFNGVLKKFKGEIYQKPPAYSAIKINGKRSYELARRGLEVDIPARRVIIYAIEVLKFDPPVIMMRITCSKGTYIRSICNDIGYELGCGGYMSFLLREATGNFNLKNSCILDNINKDSLKNYLFNPDFALNMRSIYVDDKVSHRLINGNAVRIKSNENCSRDESLKVYSQDKEFIGIGKVKGNLLKIDKLML